MSILNSRKINFDDFADTLRQKRLSLKLLKNSLDSGSKIYAKVCLQRYIAMLVNISCIAVSVWGISFLLKNNIIVSTWMRSKEPLAKNIVILIISVVLILIIRAILDKILCGEWYAYWSWYKSYMTDPKKPADLTYPEVKTYAESMFSEYSEQ